MAIKTTRRTFWERVKEALEDAKLPATQTQAAKIAGVKQPSVSDWNKPGKGPEMENALRLAKRLKVCVEWLYTESGPKRPGRPDDATAQRLWDVWPLLSEEHRGHILGYAMLNRKEPAPGGAGDGDGFPGTELPGSGNTLGDVA